MSFCCRSRPRPKTESKGGSSALSTRTTSCDAFNAAKNEENFRQVQTVEPLRLWRLRLCISLYLVRHFRCRRRTASNEYGEVSNTWKTQTRGRLAYLGCAVCICKKCMALPLNIQVNEVMGRSHDIGKLLEI